MSEEDLKTFIPKYGDRVAVQNFCKSKLSSTKKSLIEKLKRKIGSKGSGGVDSNKTGSKNYSYTGKKTRIIEIGWMCSDTRENRLRQIRTKFGGGTRRVTVNKSDKCKDILQTAIDLFFLQGVSSKGPLTMFRCELLDYKSNSFDTASTIEQMYDISALSVLRFYLATSYNTTEEPLSLSEGEDEMFIPETITSSSILTEQSEIGSAFTENVVGSTQLSETSTSTSVLPDDYNHPIHEGLTVRGVSYTVENADNILINDFLILNDNIFAKQQNIMNSRDANNEPTIQINLHRGQIFEELTTLFTECDLTEGMYIQIVLPNGEIEAGENLGGVWRDALTEFWETLLEKCTKGRNIKIPQIRHDFDDTKWVAIARILKKGWYTEQYFPI